MRDVYERQLFRRSTDVTDEMIDRPAVVLAPHPDDETLGAGGLITAKRARGIDVTIVFLTDGASSHPAIEPAELAAHRRVEATHAASILGVDADRLHFLDIADGDLDHHLDTAVDSLAQLFETVGADQIVAPHPLEPPADHRAAYDAAERALHRLGRPTPALLYPVWLWDQWPWTNPLAPPIERHGRRQVLSIARRDLLGWRLVRHLTHRLDITADLATKQHALDAHASQTSKPPDRPDWMTFADVCEGEWLERMLDPTEYYATGILGTGR